MGSSGSKESGPMPSTDACAKCLSDPATDPRFLHCNHGFCLQCVSAVGVVNNIIKCPICETETFLPEGFQVTHLRSAIVHSYPAQPIQAEVIHTQNVAIDGHVSDVLVDDVARIVYVATSHRHQPIRMFGLTGHAHGFIRSGHEVDMTGARLTLDTKRRLLLVATNHALIIFDGTGNQTAIIDLDFRCCSVTYHRQRDVYMMFAAHADKTRCLVMNPDTRDVTEEEVDLPPGGAEWIYATRDSRDQSEGALAIVCHTPYQSYSRGLSRSSQITIFDRAGAVLHTFSSSTSSEDGATDPRGVCADTTGRFLVCEVKHNRIIRVDPRRPRAHGDLSAALDLGEVGLSKPLFVTVTGDGSTVLLSGESGDYKLSIITGLCD